MLRVTVFSIALLLCDVAVGWGAQQRDWGDGRLISMDRGKIFERYEIFSGRCIFVGKKFRSLRRPKVTVDGPIKYALTEHWLYFVDDARNVHRSLFIEQCLLPPPPPPSPVSPPPEKSR